MKSLLSSVAIMAFLAVAHLADGAAKLFFFKSYSEDFKKISITNFVGGDPIFGLVNVSAIAINDNTATTIEEFADQNGNVLIQVYFASLDKTVTWSLPLNAGMVKKNRFLFAILPDKFTAAEKHFGEILKILNSNAGKILKVTIRVGKPNTTTMWEGDLSIDLTNGIGAYADWYRQNTPAELRNTNVFYNVCESNSQTYVDFHRDELTVNVFTQDSIRFIAKGTPYFCKKVANHEFLEGGKDVYYFYAARIDDQSFVLCQGDAFAYFHMNKNKASESDVNTRCPIAALEKLKVDFKKYDEEKRIAYEQQQVVVSKENKIKLTGYVKAFKSRRNDPSMEKSVTAWWNTRNPGFPVIRVVFLDPDFFLVRNEFDVVLRRVIATMIVYQGTKGTCWVQWNAFGYEHLGGGAFNSDLGAWVAGYKQFDYYQSRMTDLTLTAGTNYQVDCAGLK